MIGDCLGADLMLAVVSVTKLMSGLGIGLRDATAARGVASVGEAIEGIPIWGAAVSEVQ